MSSMRLSQFLKDAHARLHTRPPDILLLLTLVLLTVALITVALITVALLLSLHPQMYFNHHPSIRVVSLAKPHISEPLAIRVLQSLELVNPRAHQTRAQVLLQRNQRARAKVATALQTPSPLVRQLPVLKVNPPEEMEHRLKAMDLLPHQTGNPKAILTVKVAHRLQMEVLPANRMLNLKAARIATAVYHL